MSTSGFESIDQSVQVTHAWINELNDLLEWDSRPRAFRLLRVTLQTLRDWLQVNEAVDLGAQMTSLLRGIYYEHWRPAAVPVKERDKVHFLARIDHGFSTDPIDNTEEAVRAVFTLLSRRITGGEVADVRQALPADLRALWPAAPPRR